MNGNIVSAANRLGVSIVLASVIVVVGLRVLPASEGVSGAEPAPKRDDAVARASDEPARDDRSGVDICLARPDVDRVPILDLVPGEPAPATCLDTPSEEEVWSKLAESRFGPSASDLTARASMKVVIEKIGEKVDPCKVYPLAGACELVHCHFKCSVTFDEPAKATTPIGSGKVESRDEVVYIDKDYLRRCGSPVATAVSVDR